MLPCRVLAVYCWMLILLKEQIAVVADQDVVCELVREDQGELKVFGKKTDVPLNEDKCWSIDLKNSSDEVVFVFHNFNLLESDRLTVRTAAGKDSADLFGPFQGQRGVFSVFTGRSSVVVHLKTSGQKLWDRHFMAKYYINECKYDETVYNWGTFSSPLYGRDRLKALECSYSFTFIGSTSKLKKLALSFLETNLTRGSHVQIVGSEATDGKYRGENMPGKLLSSSRLQLKLQINPLQSQFQQFRAHYELATSSCSGVTVLNGSSTTFGVPFSLIPSQKSGVPASAQCHWILRSPNETRIGAYLLTDSTRIGPRDSLTVAGPSSFESLCPGGKISGIGGKYGSFQSSSNELWVTFTSPSIQSRLALQMQATIHATRGYLWNSGKFSINPESDTVGIFMLEVPSDRRVRLSLPRSRGSTMELHSDFDRSSAPFLRLLPTTPLESVVSPSNRMMLLVRKLLEASFDGVDGACHEVAQPGGSGLYTAPRSCGNYTWLLPPRSNPKELSELRFLNLDPHHPSDLVTLHALDANLTVIATLRPYENNPPPVRIPSGTGMLVTLVTQDRSAEGTALQFSCVQKKSCEGSYKLKSGQSIDLKSPSFPDRYPLGSTCQWELRWGGPILIDAHSVQLAHPSHRLTAGGVSLTGPQLTVIEGKGNKVLFTSNSGSFGEEDSGSRFWIKATALDCGGIVRERQGELIVPPGSLTCVWVVNVTSSPSKIVTSVFLKTTSNSRHLSVYENVGDTTKMELAAGRELLTHRGLALVVYNRSASSDAEPLIDITYRTEECPILSVCGGNKCMRPTWRCDGINDCGDYADETNCSVTNPPTTGHGPTSPSPGPVVTGGEGKSTSSSPTSTLNDSTKWMEGQLTKSSDAGVSVMHMSLYLVAAVVVGATIPSSVYWCLLKRQNGQRKTDSQWTMIATGRNAENADGISL